MSFHHNSVFQLAGSILFLEAGVVVVEFPLAEDELNAFSIYFAICVSYCVSIFMTSSSISIKKKKPISEFQAFNLRISSDNPLVLR